MNTLFQIVISRLAEKRAEREQARQRPPGRWIRCHCGSPIFFNNSYCLACHATLGYVPSLLEVRSFLPGDGPDEWRLAASEGITVPLPLVGRTWRRCGNFDSPAGCNWMVEVGEPWGYCVACRLNRMIPDLSDPANGVRWRKVEAAKRRLIAQLLELGLPVRPKSEDPWRGLAFEFLATLPGQARVMTGHVEGVITLNVEEADDVMREQIRTAMNEPYRTLLGHFRHEIAHHYWDQLIAPTPWLDAFRNVFGDERVDYAAALQRHYANPPVPDWPLRHVTAYASVHPWEDWAETWAHYLQIVDTLATAVGFGLGANDVDFQAAPFAVEALHDTGDPGAESFLAMINSWVELTAVLNELARSLGQRDLCPFVLSNTAVAKLHFVHLVVTRETELQTPGDFLRH
ncbi:MAG: putative zinc-binding metallopeptidase [Verrucomicrobiales bacterium]